MGVGECVEAVCRVRFLRLSLLAARKNHFPACGFLRA
jgi:hypothetical protein